MVNYFRALVCTSKCVCFHMLSLKFKKEKPVFLCIGIHMYECTHKLYFIEVEDNDCFLKDNRLHFNTSFKNLMMFFICSYPKWMQLLFSSDLMKRNTLNHLFFIFSISLVRYHSLKIGLRKLSCVSR